MLGAVATWLGDIEWLDFDNIGHRAKRHPNGRLGLIFTWNPDSYKRFRHERHFRMLDLAHSSISQMQAQWLEGTLLKKLNQVFRSHRAYST